MTFNACPETGEVPNFFQKTNSDRLHSLVLCEACLIQTRSDSVTLLAVSPAAMIAAVFWVSAALQRRA